MRYKLHYMSFSPNCVPSYFSFFFFNDTATTEIYTLSLHDALPISLVRALLAPSLDGRRRAEEEIVAEDVLRVAHVEARHDEVVELVRELRSEEHTSELQSQSNLVCRLLLEKKKKKTVDEV